MRRSDRMFEIIQILRRARGPTTAQVLADMLEVDKRTVYRDMAALLAIRVPIQGEAGVGYVMRSGFDLPPLMFTAEEVEALILGLALLGRTRDGDLQKASAAIRRKLTDVLPPHIGPIDELPLHASTWSAVPLSGVDPGLVREAIRQERKLGFDYSDADGRETTRIVLPLALTYWIDAIVVAAWCEMRGDYRHFRLDRVIRCTPLDVRFVGEGRRLRRGLVPDGSRCERGRASETVSPRAARLSADP